MTNSEGGILNYENDAVIKAVILRWERDAKIYKNDENRVSHIILKHLKPHHYEQMMHINAPVVGLRNSWFRRASITLFARVKASEKFAKFIRGFLMEAFNTFNMSRKSKDILIEMMMTGTISDEKMWEDEYTEENKNKLKQYWPGTYHRAFLLAKERLYKNSQINEPKVEYTKLQEYFKDWGGGDVFDEIAKNENINKISKDYIKYVQGYAITQMKFLSSLHNAQLNENASLGDVCLAVNGSLSKFKNKNKKDKDYGEVKTQTYGYQISMLLFNLGIIIGADTNGLEEISTNYNVKKFS